MFYMLRSVICGWNVTEEVKTACTPELLKKTFALAQKHDLGHFVGQAAADWKLPECETVVAAKQTAMQALYRYVSISYEYRRVLKVLEENRIPFIPLKGSVIREWYPQPWMRTSCDIDVLVRREDRDKASDILQTVLGYQSTGITGHDVGLAAPNGVHIELHYDTIESSVSEKSQEVLCTVWEHVIPVAGSEYHFTMPDAYFYFYHLAHMAKHFVHGGCGIRPFLDLWILDEKISYNLEQRQALLARGGISAFADAAQRLSHIWFSGEEMDPMSQKMELFILNGGTYGSVKNYVTVHESQAGSKLRFVLSRVFLSYEDIKGYFPILKKHKWLTPLFQIVRWFRIVFKGGAGHAVKELQSTAEAKKTEVDVTGELLKYLGL